MFVFVYLNQSKALKLHSACLKSVSNDYNVIKPGSRQLSHQTGHSLVDYYMTVFIIRKKTIAKITFQIMNKGI